MDREAFWLLYANLNSIAELALHRLAQEVLAEPQETNPESLTEEQLQARVMANLANLDLSALDAVYEKVASGVVTPAGIDEPQDAAAMTAGNDEPFDLERYLSQAYGSADQLRDRIDHHYQRADLTAMRSALTQLPSHLPSLTQPLSAEDMGVWVETYGQGNDALDDLLLKLRALDAAYFP